MTLVDITSVIYTITAVATLILTISNNFQIKIIHKATNSMKDELVNEVRTASLAKGRLEANIDQIIHRNGEVDQIYHKEVH